MAFDNKKVKAVEGYEKHNKHIKRVIILHQPDLSLYLTQCKQYLTQHCKLFDMHAYDWSIAWHISLDKGETLKVRCDTFSGFPVLLKLCLQWY